MLKLLAAAVLAATPPEPVPEETQDHECAPDCEVVWLPFVPDSDTEPTIGTRTEDDLIHTRKHFIARLIALGEGLPSLDVWTNAPRRPPT